MKRRRRYAIVGTGARAGMYVEAIAATYRGTAELVGLCDLSQTRMDWHNRRLGTLAGLGPRPTYPADGFDRMIAETEPDTVIVTTVDATHHFYITRAMERGCDVITEKPMTTDAGKLRAIFDTIARTGRCLRVGFNYRYAPAHTALRRLMMKGVVGRPLCVDFSWLLDTRHGADYFRRWHRERQNSGGLLVHKATHHFDLVNWWLDSYPEAVFAFGTLGFYGRRNARARGESYPYARYTGQRKARRDPFALFLDQSETLRGLYLAAEAETGYLRDRNVFGGPITIEDTLTLTARYHNGALLSYCLIAYAPWEGLRVAITGDAGRVEMDIVENVTHLMGDAVRARSRASTGAFKEATIRVRPMFRAAYEVDVPSGQGGHGGADPVMLQALFSPSPRPDAYDRAASHIDGAASLLMGFAGNESIRTGRMVRTRDLFVLPDRASPPARARRARRPVRRPRRG
jgi:predicted dehydrogenase